MRKAATVISLSLVILLAVPLASDSVVRHYRRWQASKLLATVRGLHPGTTTEAQARAALKPFSRYEEISNRQHEGKVDSVIEYRVFNTTEWIFSLANHLMRFIP